jgi:hypothetical protein
MINTRVEVNILPKRISRSISRVVYSITNYYISTTISNEFGFSGITKLRIKVIDKVGYEDTFFLVKEVPKILLS